MYVCVCSYNWNIEDDRRTRAMDLIFKDRKQLSKFSNNQLNPKFTIENEGTGARARAEQGRRYNIQEHAAYRGALENDDTTGFHNLLTRWHPGQRTYL